MVALAACQDDAAKLQEHMARGEGYAEEEHFPEAIIEFKSALQIDPNHADAHYALAQAYLRAQKPRDGFWELRETVRLDPSNHKAKLEFSQIAIIAGEAPEAIRHASSVIEAEPENFKAYIVKGEALASLERHDEALEALKQAVEVAPEEEVALLVLAKTHHRRGDKEEAEALFLKATDLHPSFDNYVRLAGFYRAHRRKHLADEEATWNKAVEVAEGSEQRQLGIAQLASFYVRNKRDDEAFSLLEKAIEEEEEESLQLIYLLARLHRGAGNKARADELIESTAERRPDDSNVYLVLSAYRARNGDFDGALAAAEKALELAPEKKRPRLQKAEMLMELGFKADREGAVEEAQAIVAGILAAEPSNPFALFVDAKIKLGKGEIRGAVEALRNALEARSHWAEARYLLGVALGVQQEYPAARSELARALEIDAGLLDAKLILSQVHFKLGEWDYCIDRGREYLREKPEDSQSRLLVAQSLVRLGKFEEAQRELEMVAPDARNGEILYALGRIQQGRGNIEKAYEYLLAANEVMPSNPARRDRGAGRRTRRRRRGGLPEGHRTRSARPLRLRAAGALLRAVRAAGGDGRDLREGAGGEAGRGPAPPLPGCALRAVGRPGAGDRALRGGDSARAGARGGEEQSRLHLRRFG
jgi:tetratricopeptide (TPR) repeat protein